jgi:integrase
LVTEMRRDEAIGLRWEDVDLDGQCLFVVQQITEVRGLSVIGIRRPKAEHDWSRSR